MKKNNKLSLIDEAIIAIANYSSLYGLDDREEEIVLRYIAEKNELGDDFKEEVLESLSQIGFNLSNKRMYELESPEFNTLLDGFFYSSSEITPLDKWQEMIFIDRESGPVCKISKNNIYRSVSLLMTNHNIKKITLEIIKKQGCQKRGLLRKNTIKYRIKIRVLSSYNEKIIMESQEEVLKRAADLENIDIKGLTWSKAFVELSSGIDDIIPLD